MDEQQNYHSSEVVFHSVLELSNDPVVAIFKSAFPNILYGVIVKVFWKQRSLIALHFLNNCRFKNLFYG